MQTDRGPKVLSPRREKERGGHYSRKGGGKKIALQKAPTIPDEFEMGQGAYIAKGRERRAGVYARERRCRRRPGGHVKGSQLTLNIAHGQPQETKENLKR